MTKKREPKPCACGCGRLVIPAIRSACGRWSQSKYFSDDCREKTLIKINKDRRRTKSVNPVYVAPNEKDKFSIHPIVNKFIYGRLA